MHEKRFCAAQTETKASSHQLPVDFLNQRIHAIAEELVNFAEAALGVEGGEVEVVALEAEGGHEVVADHFQEGGLGGGEGLAGVLFEDPVAVVAADGGVEGCEGGIEAAGAADEGDEGGQLGERLGVFRQGIELGVGFPDAERGEARGLLLEGGEHALDLVERDFLAALRLLIEKGEGVEPVLMLAAEGFELGNEGGGALAGVGIPLRADQGVLGIEVDGLEVGGAGRPDRAACTIWSTVRDRGSRNFSQNQTVAS